MAFQHSCSLQPTIFCVRNRAGKPRGQRCTTCGGTYTTVQGRYAVLPWRGDGRYTVDQALGLYSTQVMAERHVTDPDRQCVRFLVGA